MNKILKLLKTKNGIYIKNLDRFFSEHNIIKKLTGFTGSKAELFIYRRSEKKNKFYLFIDGRYEIQAKNECAFFFTNSKNEYEIINTKDNPINWIKEKIEELEITKIFCVYETLNFEEIIDLKNLISTENIPLKIRRKSVTKSIIRFNKNKIENFLKTTENREKYLLIAKPAIVCWLLEIIGNDQPYSNIKNCYCIIHNNNISLFIDKLPENIGKKLSMNNIKVYSTEEIEEFISKIPRSYEISIDIKNTSGLFSLWIKNYKTYNISDFYTGQYTDEEIEATKLAHIYDSKIMKNFLNKINEMIDNKAIFSLTEKDLAEILDQEAEKYTKQKSFPTISAFGPNSAIPHYNHSQNNSKITPNNIYLIDSGRQYRNKIFGTTDITRTIIIGKPTDEMKKNFTKVLKSHIAISSKKFSKGITGKDLDEIARLICEFPHSTGHGVSFCGPVHDLKPSISPNSNNIIKENMVFSIEPGIYIPDKYGIRTENLYYTKHSDDNKIELKPLTLVPFDQKLIDKKMLTKEEKLWLEKYHNLIFKL